MQLPRNSEALQKPPWASGGAWLALVVLLIGFLTLMVAGCNTQLLTKEKSPEHLQNRFWASVRPPAGETERLLRNARFLKMVGRTQLALKELEEAYQQDPGNLQVVDTLAQCYEELGAWQRAEELYRQALARDPDNLALANNLCFSHYQAGNWAKAESCFREALKRNPKNITARNNLGLLLARQGREAEALALWREAEAEPKATERLNRALAALGKPSISMAQAAKPSPAAVQATVQAESAAAAQAPRPETAPTTVAAAQVNSQAASPPALVEVQAPKPDAVQPPVAPATRPEAGKMAEAATIMAPMEAKPPAVTAPASSQPATPPVTAPPAAATAPPAAPEPADVKPQLKPQKTAVASAPLKSAPVKETRLPVLNSQELINTPIEILNGNGVKGTAAQSRTWLNLEGFTVAAVGNYKDYDQKQTVVTYRPGAERVAQVLAEKFYLTKALKPNPKLPKDIEVRIVLGQDQKPRQAQIAQMIATLEAKAVPLRELATAPQPLTPAVMEPDRVKAAVTQTIPVPSQPPLLTAEELSQTRIELRNGNGIQDQARQSRSVLMLEGFNVVGIKNHIDFGLDQTKISFRPGHEKVAQALAARFFQCARLEEAAKLPQEVDVKITLGRDFQGRIEVMAKLAD